MQNTTAHNNSSLQKETELNDQIANLELSKNEEIISMSEVIKLLKILLNSAVRLKINGFGLLKSAINFSYSQEYDRRFASLEKSTLELRSENENLISQNRQLEEKLTASKSMCYQLQEMLQERTLYIDKLQEKENEQRKILLDEVLIFSL